MTAVFDDAGRLIGFDQHWQLDGTYSQDLVVLTDENRDRILTEGELDAAGTLILEAAAPFRYYTVLTVGAGEPAFLSPTSHSVTFDEGRELLAVDFFLPLAEPTALPAGSTVFLIDSFENFHVAFAVEEPVSLRNPPPECEANINRFRQEITFDCD